MKTIIIGLILTSMVACSTKEEVKEKTKEDLKQEETLKNIDSLDKEIEKIREQRHQDEVNYMVEKAEKERAEEIRIENSKK